MPLPCNNVSVTPIKVSKLVRYSNLDGDDLLLTVQSGSSLWSRRSTINDLKSSLGRLTGSYSGSFTGSFKGISSGSFSGSYWGKVISRNTVASGSFSGSYWGRILSKNTKASGSFSGSFKGKSSGSFSGSHYGSLISKNTVASGSFSGSYWGRILSKNTKASGSFSGSFKGKASGSFSGSHYGSLISKNTKASGSFSGSFKGKASGSFSGSYWGRILSKNTKASGSFSGSHYGKVIGSNGSLITGSFRGIDNITNFRGTGKKVSFNGTASYAVSSSYAKTSSYLAGGSVGGDTFVNASYTIRTGAGTPSNSGTLEPFGDINATGKTLKWFKIEGSFDVSENNNVYLYGVNLGGTDLTTNVYSSWGWQHAYGYDPDNGNIITHFTIEGAPPPGVTTGTISVGVYVGGSPSAIYGYAVGYF